MGKEVGARPSKTGSRPSGKAQLHDLGAPRFDPARYRELFPINGYAPGKYFGTCQTCQTEIMADKRSWRCLDCAIANLQRSFVAIDRALRIRLWNEAKGRGMNDRNAMLYINEQRVAAIAMEAGTAETQSGSVHDSAGLQASPTPPLDPTPKGPTNE